MNDIPMVRGRGMVYFSFLGLLSGDEVRFRVCDHFSWM